MTCTEVLTTILSALKLFKMFHYFNLVCLKDSLVVGFQGNTATKPIHFVRISCEHISDLQQTFAF